MWLFVSGAFSREDRVEVVGIGLWTAVRHVVLMPVSSYKPGREGQHQHFDDSQYAQQESVAA